MPRPGVTVELVEDAPSGSAVLNSGIAYFAGVAERGRDQAVKVSSLSDYVTKFGPRTGGAVLHDSVGAYFSEGGSVLYVSTIAGTGAKAAEATVAPYKVTAAGTGEWGNDLKARVVDASAQGGPGAFQMIVAYQGTDVDRSTFLTAPEDGEHWQSDWVRLEWDETGDLAAVTAVDLAGGTEDTNPGLAGITTALDRFTYDLGGGQVACPGYPLGIQGQGAVLDHVDRTRRVALFDTPDTADVSVIKGNAESLAQNPLAKYAAMFGPWALYPGPTGSVTVTVPYSAVQAGLIARSDAATQNPNLAAAGTNGIAKAAIGLSQSYADADRTALNEAGVTLAVVRYGTIRTYGGRSSVSPANLTWRWFGGAREVAALAREFDAAGESYVLKQIDGQGALAAAFNADLSGICLEHFGRGALYGNTPDEAFSVATGPAINTPTTIANGELRASVRVKTSPTAEWVLIQVTKVALDRPLAA